MTQALEDYLKTIGLLTDRGEVRITDVADRLGVSKPSALTAVRSLEEQGYLKHGYYRTVTLTEHCFRGNAQKNAKHKAASRAVSGLNSLTNC